MVMLFIGKMFEKNLKVWITETYLENKFAGLDSQLLKYGKN